MSKEQYQQVIDCLVKFITKVTEKETASDAEVTALPETVRALVELSRV